jgi:hypothetical protein
LLAKDVGFFTSIGWIAESADETDSRVSLR